MRFATLFAFTCLPALAQIYGIGTPSYTTYSTYALSAAGHKAAVCFRVPKQTTVSGILWYAPSVTTADNIRVSIQGSSSLRPDGSTLASGITNVASSGWKKTLFDSTAVLTPGIDYWAVWDFPSYNGGNLTVNAAGYSVNVLTLYPALRARFDGSSWTSTYDVKGNTAFLLYDQSGVIAPHSGVHFATGVETSLASGSRAALEFTATKAITIAGVQWVSNADQAASGVVRLYRNGSLATQVSVPTFGTTSGTPHRRYAYFPGEVTIAPGNRVKIVLQCTSGAWGIWGGRNSSMHSDAWPIWNWLKRLFWYIESPVCGLADSSDNISSTSYCYILVPVLGRSTILGGGFITQQ
jgi:hypothetical protein